LDSLDYLESEDNPLVWEVALSGLMRINHAMALAVPTHQVFKFRITSLLGNFLKSRDLDWTDHPNDNFIANSQRGTIRLYAGKFGHNDTIAKADDLFWNRTGKTYPVDLRQAVYYLAVSNGGVDAYFEILRLYKAAPSAAEQTKCLYALAGARDPALVTNTLHMILDATVIRKQDGPRLLHRLAADSISNAYLAWDFIKDHSGEFKARYGRSHFEIAELVESVASQFLTETKLHEVQEFFNSRIDSTAHMSLKQALETVQTNIEWIKRNAAELDAYFQHLYF